MAFPRNDLSDRRRRLLRDTANQEGKPRAVRSANKASQRDDDESATSNAKRDVGYSQDVRRSCQHRLIQLIPIRRTSVLMVIAVGWAVWFCLLAAHYIVLGNDDTPQNRIALTELVNLRSTHSIAHWLVVQLWMLTGFAGVMIYQIRKHKLDDYSAQYRIWLGLVVAAFLASLDASSQGLLLLGASIDPWCRQEIGYSGWAMVWITVVVLVGGLGLRLCTELKTAPGSLTLWLTGLSLWAMSSLLGTDMINTAWSKKTTDMVVGGAWLGGVLAVWMSAGLYLRYIFIQAQKRVVIRGGLVPARIEWKIPKVKLRRTARNKETDSIDDRGDARSDDEQSRMRWLKAPRWSMVFQRSSRNNDDGTSDGEETPRQRRRREAELRREQSRLLAEEKRVARDLAKREAQERRAESLKAKREADGREPTRWSFTISHMRSRPKTDAAEKPEGTKRAPSTDEGETSRTEKRGWVPRFSRSTRTDAAESSTSASKSSHQQTIERRKNDSSRQSDQGDTQQRAKTNWWSRKPKDLSLDMSAKPKSAAASSNTDATEKKSQSQWLRNRFNKKQTTTDKPVAEAPKRSWFGFLDSLKLKPPGEPVEPKTKTTITRPTSSGASEPRPVAGSVNSSSRPIQNQSTAANRSSGPATYDEYDDEDRQDRHLSKAERKRLRRMNDQNRAA